MNKKELIAKLLNKLSEEDLMELLSDEPEPKQEEQVNVHIHSTRSEGTSHRRKGRGHSKNSKMPRKSKGNKRSSKKYTNSKGRACRVLPIDIDSDRVNKFEEMIGSANLDANERVELAKASQEDEKAREVKTSFKKSSRQSSLVDVECCVCGDDYEVSSTLVGNIDRWKCNSCSCQAGY